MATSFFTSYKGFNLVLLMVLSLNLAACGGPRSPYNYSEQEKIFTYGDVGQTKDVLKGDTILHYQVESVADVLEVPRPLNMDRGIFISVFIPKGLYVKTGEDESRIFFEPKSTKGDKAKTSEYDVTDLVYHKHTHELTITVEEEPMMRTFSSGFTIKKNMRLKEKDGDDNLRSLSYAGSHKKLVSFEYREGANKQRITHNTENGPIFRYQGAEVEVISYDEKSLRCKVLKEFDVFK